MKYTTIRTHRVYRSGRLIETIKETAANGVKVARLIAQYRGLGCDVEENGE